MVSNPTKGFFSVRNLSNYYNVGMYLDTYPECRNYYPSESKFIQQEAADSELLKALCGR